MVETTTAPAAPAPEVVADPKAPVVEGASDPVTSETTKEAAREAIRRHKVKVSGEEREVDEEELKRGYSHGQAAAKVMQEATRLRKQNEEFVKRMKDPASLIDAIKQLGHDPRKLSEEYLVSILEDEVMDPKDKELKLLKQEVEHRREQERLEREAKESKIHEALKAKYAQDYSEQFVTALKESQLPPTKHAVAEMAKYVHRAAEIGVKISAKEAAQLVKEDFQKIIQTALGESDGETLIRLLGEGAANKVREWDTKRLKDPSQGLKNTSPASQTRERRDPSKRMSHQQWREFNRK